MFATGTSNGSAFLNEITEVYKPGVFKQKDRVIEALKGKYDKDRLIFNLANVFTSQMK